MIRTVAIALPSACAMAIAASAALAEGRRDLGAHVHGVSELGVVIEGQVLLIEVFAPGADVVGFEFEPTSSDDRAAVAEAVVTLQDPIALFGVPADAACTLVAMDVAYISDADHSGHNHGVYGYGGAQPDGEDQAGGAAQARGDARDDGAETAAGRAEAAAGRVEAAAGHAEFAAEYVLSCGAPDELEALTLAWFELFPNAEEVAAVVVRDGAQFGAGATAASPVLDLVAR